MAVLRLRPPTAPAPRPLAPAPTRRAPELRPAGGSGGTRALQALVDGIGPDNPGNLASWNPATGESVFFDVLGTDEKESRDELVVQALVDALDYLATPFGGDRSGGYATTDQSQWLWGLKIGRAHV